MIVIVGDELERMWKELIILVYNCIDALKNVMAFSRAFFSPVLSAAHGRLLYLTLIQGLLWAVHSFSAAEAIIFSYWSLRNNTYEYVKNLRLLYSGPAEYS
jgi:hypothetical protein